ncbi:MAG: FAD-binding oxidoreductase, partial [Phycisphaerae bacterium]
MLYATDASIYQVAPLGVVIPRDIETMVRIVKYCGRHKLALLPRGGGTSLPGQCTNRAVVVDHSAYCREVLAVDPVQRTCDVEPGITIDDLNRELERRRQEAVASGQSPGLEGSEWGGGLFFAPDPATAAQATIGGCIGNNAAGARSIRYGRTVENVAALNVILTNGDRTWLEAGAGQQSVIAKALAEKVINVVRRYEKQIRERYPKTTRRNAGYALDLILQQLDKGVTAADLDLTGLLCGSEGTLAVVLGARLRLHPIPRSKGLAIASFATLEDAIQAVVPILKTGPSAVELLDDVVLGAARGNPECRTYMDLLAEVAGTAPAAVLYVEYQETGPQAQVVEKFAALERVLPQVPIRKYLDQPALLRAWALRKAGEPLLHGLAAARKPVTCVEDNAVPVERLVEFVARFKQIIAKHGTTAAYYAHASVGVLHVRPLLNLHDEADLDRLRAIAVEVADLARECGGVMSGEHGDGRLRGPLLEHFYGTELMQAFREIKAIFDPAGVLNPGNIVGAGPIASITEQLRIKPAGVPLHWPDGDGH